MKLKHYLIASPENHYQPWILSKTAMVCFCLAIWSLRLFIPVSFAESAPGLDNQDLMARINIERTNRFLPALATNSKLNSAAGIKSNDMLARSYFAHVNPDGDYVWPVIESQGYSPYQSLGENLAMDFTTSEGVVAAWMNSPGHRANILNEKFEDQGMSAIYGEFEPNHNTYVVTNLFGTLLKKVASSNTPAPTPAPNPSPTVKASPTPAPNPVPTQTSEVPTVVPDTSQDQQNPTTSSEPLISVGDPNGSAIYPLTGKAATRPSPDNIFYLKTLLGLFAGIYTIFLGIDSLIIHRARITRTSLPSSPHSLMLFLISAVNLLTLWI